MKKCPVCGAGLRAFRRLFLRRVYWYYECEDKPGHYVWPERYGFDTIEELEKS